MHKTLKNVLAGLAITLGTATSLFAAEPIKIGSVLSVTGPAAYLGDPELKTLQMYVEELNEQGGVLGRPLELVFYDDGSNANKANGFAKRLIENDGVDFIVGGSTTGATMSMAPVVEKAGVPFMSLAGSVVVVEPVKKWIFKASTTDRNAAERVFADMKAKGITKIAFLHDSSGFGQSGKKETEKVVGDFGIDIVMTESYGAKDTDMTPQLAKIKNNPEVQALFVFGAGQGPALVSKNAKQIGLSIPFYNAHGVGSDEYIQLAGPASEGNYGLAPALMIADKLDDSDPQKPATTAYVNAYKTRYKEHVSMFGGQAHDNLFIVLDAIKRVGSTDKAKVRDAIEATKGFIGTGGEVNMSPTDHMGLTMWSLRLLQVKDGTWIEAPKD